MTMRVEWEEDDWADANDYMGIATYHYAGTVLRFTHGWFRPKVVIRRDDGITVKKRADDPSLRYGHCTPA